MTKQDDVQSLIAGEKPPIEQFLDVSTLPDKGRHVFLEANDKDLPALASFFEVEQIVSIDCEMHLTPIKGHKIKVEGKISGEIIQKCSVTLEPIESKVSTVIDTLLIPESSSVKHNKYDDDGALIVTLDDELSDTYAGNRVDVAALALEALGLAIDPYPRKENAEFETYDERDKESSPFDVLGKLKDGSE